MEKPQRPTHQRNKKAQAKKVEPADAQVAPPDAKIADAVDVADGDTSNIKKVMPPKVQVSGLEPWVGAKLPDDDARLTSRPKTVVTPTSPACGLGTAGLEQARSFAPKTKSPSIKIVSPRPGETILTTRLRLRASVANFKTWKNDKSGSQYLRVVLDNEGSRPWYDPDTSPFSIDGLSPGWHSVRVFAVRPWGEVVRGAEAFDAINFYVRTKRGSPDPLDMTQPSLTYASPTGIHRDLASRRILLDFHVANVALQAKGHRIRVSLNDNPPCEVTHWAPTWLEELPPGKYKVRLELLGPTGTPLGGPLQSAEGQFEVQRTP